MKKKLNKSIIAGMLGLGACAPIMVNAEHPSIKKQQAFSPYTQQIQGLSAGIDMVAVKGGAFQMGNTGVLKGAADEQTIVNVKIDPFWISKYEISWDVYESFVFEMLDKTEQHIFTVGLDAVTRPTPPYIDMTQGMGKRGYPAIGMTQYNAIQFCKWLYTRTGVFYRLPTEAEWEYAAKAGTKSNYFFGENSEQIDDYAWYVGNSDGKTHPVGSKKPNPWGIHDMSGNVSEWTFDQYDERYYDSLSTEKGVVSNPSKFPHKLYPISVRGGSFRDDVDRLRSSARGYSEPSWKALDPQTPKSDWWFTMMPTIGVRLVRPQTPPDLETIRAYYNFEPEPDF